MNKAPQRTALAGIRVLVGRARHQASALSAGLRELGADVAEVPFIEIRPPKSYKAFDVALKQIEAFDWLVLTSVNGVDALAARMKRLRIEARRLQALKIAAIGPATRDAIKSLGLKVALVPRRYVAEAVVESLQGKVKGKRVLLARARVARDVIPRELRKMGGKVDLVEAYETVVPPGSKIKLQRLMRNPELRPQLVCFTSSSTVRNFVELAGGARRVVQFEKFALRFASIGPITSATLREYGLTAHIEAREYTIPGLIRAIVARVQSP
jgi:uroporphyrinogen-III synthase